MARAFMYAKLFMLRQLVMDGTHSQWPDLEALFTQDRARSGLTSRRTRVGAGANQEDGSTPSRMNLTAGARL